MQINEWPGWFKSLGIEKKWFVIIVLIRPVLEGFFLLKETSIFLSPLYWMGVGVPLAIIWTIFTKYKKPAQGIPGGAGFRFFGFFVLLSVILLLMRADGPSAIQAVLRITTILFLFAYAVRYLNDWRDVEGVLIAFLFAAVYPLLLMMYEILVNPINVEMSRDLERIRGFYADSFNYSIYLVLSTVLLLYFRGRWKWLNYKVMLPFIVVVLLGLYHLNHIASWGAFITVVASRIVSSPKKVVGLFVAVVLIAPVIIQQELDSDVLYESKLLGNEYEILMGERPVEQAFHGRVTRWEYYYGIIQSAGPQVWLLGIYADFEIYPEPGYVLVAPHNDYLRIFVLAGVPGLLGYLVFLVSVLKNASKLDENRRFLKYALVAVVAIYSVSAIPTIYPALMTIILTGILAGGRSREITESGG